MQHESNARTSKKGGRIRATQGRKKENETERRVEGGRIASTGTFYLIRLNPWVCCGDFVVGRLHTRSQTVAPIPLQQKGTKNKIDLTFPESNFHPFLFLPPTSFVVFSFGFRFTVGNCFPFHCPTLLFPRSGIPPSSVIALSTVRSSSMNSTPDRPAIEPARFRIPGHVLIPPTRSVRHKFPRLFRAMYATHASSVIVRPASKHFR